MEASVDLDTLQPAAAQPRGLVFTVFADRYGPSAELAGLRQSFAAASVSHAISVDRRHGIVMLAPGGTTLRVGSGAEEYERVRIIERSMGFTGIMSCSSDGTVTWRVTSQQPAGPDQAGTQMP